jgi:hypothetical protein
MKKLLTSATCVFIGMNLYADDVKQPFIIKRGEETLVITDMPKFTQSEPITNSFVYYNGEYIPPPYVVSVSNLTVFINGFIIENFEPLVQKREWYTGRIGGTPETVGKSVDELAEYNVRSLKEGAIFHLINGRPRISFAQRDGDGRALAIIEKARKATQGDEKAKQELIKDMGLENSMSFVHPDWIERLANHTNLETRATTIIEAKREKERLEKEKREQQNKP